TRNFTDTTSTLGTAPCAGLHGSMHAGPNNNGYATINRWFIEKTASLCQKLQAIPDGAGTLLDSATVWCGSEMHGSNEDGPGLAQLVVGVHDERAVARDGLADGVARERQQTRGRLGAREEAVAGAEHGELAGGDLRARGAERGLAVEDVDEGVVRRGHAVADA